VKKVYFLFFLIFIIFSCKGTPKKDKGADDLGLSQLELTTEEDRIEAGSGVNKGLSSHEDTLAQDGITEDGSEIAEDTEEEAVTDDFQADEQVEEKPLIVESVDEVKETSEGKNPSVEEKKPPVSIAKPAQPPPAVAKEEHPVTDVPAAEQSDQEKQDDTTQSENAGEQETAPPRSQPWLAPPPAVSAVRDNAPLPNRQGLVPQKEEEIVFSRIVRTTAGQIVEIPFRGTGWVYLGEMASRRGLVYNSRRLDPEGQSFIFTAEEAGTYALKFYRQDFIRDYILNDYVQVIVGESVKSGGAGLINPPADRSRVTAEPRWPSALDEAALLRGGAKTSPGAAVQSTPENKNSSLSPSPQTESSQTAPSQAVSANRDSSSETRGTVVPSPAVSANRESAPSQAQGTGTAPPAMVSPVVTPPVTAPEKQTAVETPAVEKQEKLPPEEILKKAQDSFNGGNTAAAIALLDQFMEYYPNGSDELYWLYGQFYEANTPQRNILLSLDYYRRLVNEYPQSRRYNDARRRIAYLERFYVNIQ